MVYITIVLLVFMGIVSFSLFYDFGSGVLTNILKQMHPIKQEAENNREINASFKAFHAIGALFFKTPGVFFSEAIQKKFKMLLSQSGSNTQMDEHYFITTVLGIWTVTIPLMGLLFLTYKETSTRIILSVVGCYFLTWPFIWLKEKANKRIDDIKRELPSVIASIGTAMEVGTSLTQSIYDVTQYKKGHFSDELKITLGEIEMGLSRTQALKRLDERLMVNEVTLLVSLFTQGIEKGSYGLSRTVITFADELWNSRVERARTMAAKASIKLFLPLLLLVFPAMMIFILSPAVFSIMQLF